MLKFLEFVSRHKILILILFFPLFCGRAYFAVQIDVDNNIRNWLNRYLLHSLIPQSAFAQPDLTKEVNTLASLDGTHLAYRNYSCGNPKGIVLAFHGIQSHSRWYVGSSQLFADNGYCVYFPDRRGSGLNQRDRGHLNRYEDLFADSDAFLAEIVRNHGKTPIFLLGISWGGKQALLYASQRRDQFKGVVLSTPGIVSRADLDPADKLRVSVGGLLPIKTGSKIRIPIGGPEMFTDDPKWQDWIRNDGLALKRATPNFFRESKKMDVALQKHVHLIGIPVLLQLAGGDEVIDNVKTRSYLQNGLPMSQRGGLDIKVYEKARHTLEFEPNSEKIFKDVIEWLDRHSKTPSR